MPAVMQQQQHHQQQQQMMQMMMQAPLKGVKLEGQGPSLLNIPVNTTVFQQAGRGKGPAVSSSTTTPRNQAEVAVRVDAFHSANMQA